MTPTPKPLVRLSHADLLRLHRLCAPPSTKSQPKPAQTPKRPTTATPASWNPADCL